MGLKVGERDLAFGVGVAAVDDVVGGGFETDGALWRVSRCGGIGYDWGGCVPVMRMMVLEEIVGATL